MQPIFLHDQWHSFISTDDTPYFEPNIDDRAWQASQALRALNATERLWLRHSFEMPPNDECSTWWLEVATPLPAGTQLWVNYEALDLANSLDVTYAVFMGKNVVTVCITEGEQWRKNPEIPKITLVPRPCLL